MAVNEGSNFYKESGEIRANGALFRACVYCFHHEKRLELSLKYLTASGFPKQQIVGFEYCLDSEPGRNTVLFSAYREDEVTLKTLYYHSEQVVNIQIRGRVDQFSSAVLTEIARNPAPLLSDPHLCKLPTEFLEFLLKFKYFNVPTEDFVLGVVSAWLEQCPHIPAEQEISALLQHIRWGYISLSSLLKTAAGSLILRNSPSFSASFKKELGSKPIQSKTPLKRKSTLLGTVDIESGPRRSYKATLTVKTYETHSSYIEEIAGILLEIPPSNDNEDIESLSREINSMQNEAITLRMQQSYLSSESVSVTDSSQVEHSFLYKYKENTSPLHATQKERETHSAFRSSRKTGKLLQDLAAKLQHRRKPENFQI